MIRIPSKEMVMLTQMRCWKTFLKAGWTVTLPDNVTIPPLFRVPDPEEDDDEDDDEDLEGCRQELAAEAEPPQPPQGDEEATRRIEEEWRQKSRRTV